MTTHSIMRKRKIHQRQGFSLIDVVVGISIFLIIALGILTYRYKSKLDVVKAEQQLTAADLATTVIETWQGVSGSETFDPETVFASNLSISSATGPSQPSGYTLLGNYDVVDDSKTYQLTLSWQDVNPSLRTLNVLVTWLYVNETQQRTYQLSTYVTL